MSVWSGMYDKFKDECGVFGILDHHDAANLTYLGLYALQHRGQESAGIASVSTRPTASEQNVGRAAANDGTGEAFIASSTPQIHVEKDMGYVAEIFTEDRLARLPGNCAIGHVRYSTAGGSMLCNAQPLSASTRFGPIAVAHNGNLINGVQMRHDLEQDGSIFNTMSDTEVIVHLIARSRASSLEDAVVDALTQVEGAFSLLILSPGSIIAARDPHGFRPLSLGLLDNSLVASSESCAFDLIAATMLREVAPGEIVVLEQAHDPMEGIRTIHRREQSRIAQCVFEHVYFARPDSAIFGNTVAQVRKRFGAKLAQEHPVDADVVVPVPDSGVFAALGYARESGIPFEYGLVRNHYVGRTFIEPKQSIRHFGVKVKLNPVREVIEGKRIVLIDDSIVRGTTSKKIVRMLKNSGAAEVHMRISSPPTTGPCYYGIDTPRRKELIASAQSVDEIRRYIEADTLGYLSLDGMLQAAASGDGDPATKFCAACFTGDYPLLDDAKRRERAALAAND